MKLIGDDVMIYQLDEIVFYDDRIMKVWDYSPRNKSYTLSVLNEEEFVSNATGEDIETETNEEFKRYAEQFIKGINRAEWDVNTNGYGFLKSFGTFFVKIYQNEIFQSPKFLHILQEEMKKDKDGKELK
jgi:hypothetical protein